MEGGEAVHHLMISIILPSASEKKISSTLQEVEELFPEAQVIVSNDRYRKGKGWAIRQAIQEAKGDLIVFLDGDGDIKPKMLKRLLPFIEDYDIVCGVKPISGLWQRRVITYLSQLYLALFFSVKVDTQTGIKLFKRKALQKFYNDGFLFDLEILCLAKKKGYSMIEVPIEANITRRVKLISLWNTLKESITLWLELR